MSIKSGDRISSNGGETSVGFPEDQDDRLFSVAYHQHREVMGKIQELVNAVHGINAGIVTSFYLLLVSYFFYIERIQDYVWIFMTLAGMTQFLGEKILKNALKIRRTQDQ